jgi:hypothetical protein
MVAFVYLPSNPQQFAVVDQPRVLGGPEGIAGSRGVVCLPEPRIGTVEGLAGGEVTVYNLPTKGPGMPEQMVNPGLMPFPERIRRIKAITIQQAVRMQHRRRFQ